MKTLILIFFITVNIFITLAAKEPVYSYEKNKSVLFIGGCHKGGLPNHSIDFSNIKDLTLKYKLVQAFRSGIEPTAFIFVIDDEENSLNTVNSNVVDIMCKSEKMKKININYYKIEGLEDDDDYYYLDEVLE